MKKFVKWLTNLLFLALAILMIIAYTSKNPITEKKQIWILNNFFTFYLPNSKEYQFEFIWDLKASSQPLNVDNNFVFKRIE